MARKQSSNNKVGATKAIAFWAFVICAVIYLLNLLLRKGFGFSLSVLSWVEFAAKFILYIVAAVYAYSYVKNKSIAWKLLYILTLLIVFTLALPISNLL